MNNVRDDVAKLLSGSTTTPINPNNGQPSSTGGNMAKTQLSRILRRGCEGDDVKLLQQYLIKVGCDLGSWGADGDFGKATEDAVISFQKLHKLDADGEVGPLTWAALQTAVEEASVP